MTEDQMNPDICPSALEEDGRFKYMEHEFECSDIIGYKIVDIETGTDCVFENKDFETTKKSLQS